MGTLAISFYEADATLRQSQIDHHRLVFLVTTDTGSRWTLSSSWPTGLHWKISHCNELLQLQEGPKAARLRSEAHLRSRAHFRPRAVTSLEVFAVMLPTWSSSWINYPRPQPKATHPHQIMGKVRGDLRQTAEKPGLKARLYRIDNYHVWLRPEDRSRGKSDVGPPARRHGEPSKWGSRETWISSLQSPAPGEKSFLLFYFLFNLRAPEKWLSCFIQGVQQL